MVVRWREQPFFAVSLNSYCCSYHALHGETIGELIVQALERDRRNRPVSCPIESTSLGDGKDLSKWIYAVAALCFIGVVGKATSGDEMWIFKKKSPMP
jgi:hypothetical protein